MVHKSTQVSGGGGGGSGTVTEIDTGTGLTGGPITASGTVSIAANTANTLAGFNNSGVFSDVTIGSGLSLASGSLSASPTFDLIGGGTNTTATMIVGTGGNIHASGSGVVTATAAPASGITGTTLSSNVTASSLTSFGASIALGTPASGVATNLTGTAASLTAGTVTTNANLTGPVTSTGNATAIANGAITNAMLANGAVANLSGTNTGDQTITLTGNVTGSGTGSFATTIASSVALSGSPTTTTQTAGDSSTKLATTAFVANAVLGQDFKEACKYATTAALPTVVYANGSSGVGATLTAVGVGAISLDGSTPSVSDRILVKNQASTFQNGIYTVTIVGTAGTVFVLTRSLDANQSYEFSTGDSVFVTSGSTLATTTWAYTGVDSPTIGTDAITFAQTAGQGSFTAGNGIAITGTSIAIDTSVTVDKTTSQTLTNKTLTSPTLTTPVLGTPSSGTLTNCTFPTLNQNTTGSAASLSISGQSGLMTVSGLASTNRNKVVRDAADTILELGGSYTPTGTWTSLTMVTPTLGVATATSINKMAITTPASSSTLAVADGKTFTASNTITLTGTDSVSANVSNLKIRTIGFSATGTLATGQQGAYVVFPVAGTITGWSIVANAGTATVKVWKIAAGTTAPAVGNNINTSGVALSSGTMLQSTDVSDFTSTTVTAGDTFAFNLTAVATVTILDFQLQITVT